jgi:uncharacterized protein YdeI (YjbR/CyaY-like superfamily)
MEDILFFEKPEDFRRWLEANHDQKKMQWVGYYKKNSGKASITWSESVDQALCFGWIDGLRKSIDEEAYKIRFTPRQVKSHWSKVNLKRMPELIEMGLVYPAGMAIYEKRDPKYYQSVSYEQEEVALSPEYEKQLRANAKAADFFYEQLAPSYRRSSINWVMSAKREPTRQKRLAVLIESSEQGLKIPLIRG